MTDDNIIDQLDACPDCRRKDAEIERLCAAGDALAEALGGAQRRHPCDCADRFDARTGAAAVIAWEEARRG